MRKIINHRQCNNMIKLYETIKDITDSGGVAYECKSAIWAFEPVRKRVTLFVKNPTEMTNDIIDYTPSSKHYETHRDRILKLTGAEPTAYTMKSDFDNMIRKWS